MKIYQDKRGWIFFTRAGLGENTFKAFYTKNMDDYLHGVRAHAVKSLEWRTTKEEAQKDLDEYAVKHKMNEVKKSEGRY